jgi:hypothetical protein
MHPVIFKNYFGPDSFLRSGAKTKVLNSNLTCLGCDLSVEVDGVPVDLLDVGSGMVEGG